jgi:DNA-binding MarR family transcriptional regulator
MSTFEAPKVQTTSNSVRFSKQQRGVLLWMLEQEPRKKMLIEAETTNREPYEPKSIVWSSREFLGSEPTNNQSSALSRTLSSLENRKLITLHRSEGKKPRTSHVSFTRQGRIYAEALKEGFSVTMKKDTGPAWTSSDSARKTMLELGIIVFRRELERARAALNAGTDDYTSFDIPSIDGGISRTRDDVSLYWQMTKQALKTAEELNQEGSRKFMEIMQRLVDLGALTYHQENGDVDSSES